MSHKKTIADTIRIHFECSQKAARAATVDLIEMVKMESDLVVVAKDCLECRFSINNLCWLTGMQLEFDGLGTKTIHYKKSRDCPGYGSFVLVKVT